MRTTIDFDKARSGRLDLEGVDLDHLEDRPLSPDALRHVALVAPGRLGVLPNREVGFLAHYLFDGCSARWRAAARPEPTGPARSA